jgi:hypothetical protein
MLLFLLVQLLVLAEYVVERAGCAYLRICVSINYTVLFSTLITSVNVLKSLQSVQHNKYASSAQCGQLRTVYTCAH